MVLTALQGRTLLLILVATAFAIRIVWQLFIGFYVGPEAYEPDATARNILAGRGDVLDVHGTTWRTHGMSFYPHLLAFLHVLSGGPDGYLFIGIVQALASAALVAGTFALAARLADRTAAFVAATIVAFHPGLVIYAAKVTELSVDSLIALLIALSSVQAVHDRTASGPVRFGAAAALGALARPTLAAASWAMLAVLALMRRDRLFLLAAVLLVVGMMPTTIKNSAIGYQGALTPGNCAQLWVGNNDAASGDAYGRDGRSVFESMSPTLQARVAGRTEEEQGRAFCDDAFAFLTRDPLYTAGWWAQKLAWFWWFTPHAGRSYPEGWHDLYRVGWILEAALALAGAILIWRRGDRRALIVLAVMLLAISGAQSFFYVEGRHRLLLEPIVASCAAAGIVALAGLRRRARASFSGIPR